MLARTCPKCSGSLAAQARFCPRCGTASDTPPAAVATPSARRALRMALLGWLLLLVGLGLIVAWVFRRVGFWPAGIVGIALFGIGLGQLTDDPAKASRARK